jgi:hypothetical protein
MLIAWSPGQQLLAGHTVDINYPYPLWTVVVMLPFAIWSPKVAMLLWFLTNILMLATSICILIELLSGSISPLRLVLVVAAVGFFFPVLTSIWLGQLTIFSLLVLIMIPYAIMRQQWWQVGIYLGLSLIKPQVTILVTVAVLAWALWTRRWRIIAGFGCVMVLLVVIALPFASSLRQIIGGGVDNHLFLYLDKTSTLWALCLTLQSSWALPMAISIALLIWLGYLWLPLFRRDISFDRVTFLIALTTVVNLLIIPYSWMHNLLLLVFPAGYGLACAWRLSCIGRSLWSIVLIALMHPFFLLIYFTLTLSSNSQAYQIIPAVILLPMLFIIQWQVDNHSMRLPFTGFAE